MELDQVLTPLKQQKLRCKEYVSQKKPSSTMGGAMSSLCSNYIKMVHPRTPSKHCNSTGIGATVTASSTFTNASGSSSSSSSIHISYTAAANTPPAKRFQRVRNPFEPVMTERLHLPLIASPSLFQRPTTPQLSSTQFEWTIDEVSSLKPTHVEPHETQFHDSPDPEYEAKAQSAISSYFKEQQIVPSPVDCPLRSQRIILSELNANTPVTKSGRRIRDCGTQTDLTLPAVLPRALEEALRPYLQPHLSQLDKVADSRACEDEQVRFSSDSGMAYFSATDNKNISLRRQLFDIYNIDVLDSENCAGVTASVDGENKCNNSPSTCGAREPIAIVGKLSDSCDKSSFGSLSPILANDDISASPRSPHSSASKMRSQLHTFLQTLAETEQLSPIHPPVSHTSRRRTEKTNAKTEITKHSYRCSELNRSEAATIGEISLVDGAECVNDGEKFTPDRSSSPLLHLHKSLAEIGGTLGHHSIDSNFNMKVSRLAVNSSKCSKQRAARRVDTDALAPDDTDEMLDDDDDMQVSQLSTHSLNCSSSNSSDTPRSKRRSASRKNLSQSFSLNWLEDEDDDAALEKRDKHLDVPRIDISSVDEIIVMQQANVQRAQKTEAKEAAAVQRNCDSDAVKRNDDNEAVRAVFYRTDSGFNEMPTSGSNSMCAISSGLQQGEGYLEYAQNCTNNARLSPNAQMNDVSMVCCSTPSRRTAAAVSS